MASIDLARKFTMGKFRPADSILENLTLRLNDSLEDSVPSSMDYSIDIQDAIDDTTVEFNVMFEQPVYFVNTRNAGYGRFNGISVKVSGVRYSTYPCGAPINVGYQLSVSPYNTISILPEPVGDTRGYFLATVGGVLDIPLVFFEESLDDIDLQAIFKTLMACMESE